MEELPLESTDPVVTRSKWRPESPRAALAYTVVRYANVALGVLSNALIARALGPADYGFILAVISMTAVASLASDWSTDQYVVRQVARLGVVEARDRIHEAVRVRLAIGPVSGLVLIAALLALRPGVGLGEVIAGAAAWTPIAMGFSALGPSLLLATGRTRRFVWMTQISGVLWSAGAIGVALLHPTVAAAGVTFGATGWLTGALYLLGARDLGVSLLPQRRKQKRTLMLMRQLAPTALAQLGLIAPWRLVPVVIALVVSPAFAGLVLASLVFWEQLAVPAIGLAQVQSRRVARGDTDDVSHVLHQVVFAVGGMTVVGIPGSIIYVKVVLGAEYSSLAPDALAGLGMVAVTGLAQALVPLLVASGLAREARRLGLWSTGLLLVLAVTLFFVDSVASILLATTIVAGGGVLVGLLVTLRPSIAVPIVPMLLLLATYLCVGLAFLVT
jgi:O-antigen/teichoic acid export membrane protein